MSIPRFPRRALQILTSVPAPAVMAAALAVLLSVLAALPAGAANYGPKMANYPQPKKPAEPEPPMVFRLVSAQRGRYYGNDVLVVTGIAALDGKQVQMAIPNGDTKAGKYDPKPELAGVVNGLKAGDYAKVEVDKKDQVVWIKKVSEYKVSPGEDQPNTYVFDESYSKGEKGAEQLAVRMSRFAKFFEVVVAQKRNDAKAMVTDPDLAAKVNAFKKGDVVEADVQGAGATPVVTAIDLYKAPEEAKFQKLTDIEVDGQKYPAVELDQNGKTVSLPLTGKVVSKKLTPDARLASAARAIRPGTEILFRTTDDGGKTYLKEIHAAPKQPAKTGTKAGGNPDMKAAAK